MRGHHLRLFKRTIVQKIRRNARGAEGVAPDRGEDTRLQCPPLYHAVGVNAVQASVGELLCLSERGAEKRRLFILGSDGGRHVLVEILLKLMVAGKSVLLAALFMQPHPRTLALHVDVFNVHVHGGRDAGKGVDQKRDEGPVAQTYYSVGFNGIQEPAGFFTAQHRRLSLLDHILWSAHRSSRIGRYDLTHHQPVKEHSDGGEVLFDSGWRMCLCHALDVAGHMVRPDLDKLAHTAALAPGKKITHIVEVCGARVQVTDVRSKKFQKAVRTAFTGGNNNGRERL